MASIALGERVSDPVSPVPPAPPGPEPQPLPMLLRFTAAVADAVDRVDHVDPRFLSPTDKQQALSELAVLEERFRALRVTVQGVSADAADAAGARDAGQLLASRTRRDRRGCAGEQRLADALAARWRAVEAAWRQGRVNRDQVRMIVEALDRLPAGLDPALAAKAEAHLIGLAAEHGPAALRRLGRRLWEVICPDEADEAERRALEREERRARARCRLDLRRMGDGSTRISGRIPDHVAARLETLLEAHTSPRRDHREYGGAVRDPATGERLPADRLRGHAFCTLIEHADPDRLPRHGQTATTVMVTVELDRLLNDAGVAELLDGTPIPAGELRRLACTAGVLPAVLGSDSQPLDLGRTTRLFTPAQRKALAVRDRTCRAEHCDTPAPWCEAHHLSPWSTGGRTDLADGILLCPFHHHRVHAPAYDHERLPSGDVRFHRRP